MLGDKIIGERQPENGVLSFQAAFGYWHGLAIPLIPFQADMGFVSQLHTFIAQQIRLRRPTRHQPPCGIDHAVTRIIAVVRRIAQHAADQAGVFIPTD